MSNYKYNKYKNKYINYRNQGGGGGPDNLTKINKLVFLEKLIQQIFPTNETDNDVINIIFEKVRVYVIANNNNARLLKTHIDNSIKNLDISDVKDKLLHLLSIINNHIAELSKIIDILILYKKSYLISIKPTTTTTMSSYQDTHNSDPGSKKAKSIQDIILYKETYDALVTKLNNNVNDFETECILLYKIPNLDSIKDKLIFLVPFIIVIPGIIKIFPSVNSLTDDDQIFIDIVSNHINESNRKDINPFKSVLKTFDNFNTTQTDSKLLFDKYCISISTINSTGKELFLLTSNTQLSTVLTSYNTHVNEANEIIDSIAEHQRNEQV